MNNNEFNIQQKERTFFSTISFNVPSGSSINYLCSVIQEVIKEYSIAEDRIIDIHFFKTEQKGKELKSVSIKYCKFNSYELKTMDKEEQIRFVLKMMGYSDRNIKSVTYRKYWSNSDELVWVAVISDPNYNFDQDESFSARNYEMSVRNKIKKVLGFLVIVDFI